MQFKNLSKFIEIKIFPTNYSFENELNNNGLGILIRGSIEMRTGSKISTNLDTGFIISKRNKKVDLQTEIISKTPLTVVWIPTNKIAEFESIIPNFNSFLS